MNPRAHHSIRESGGTDPASPPVRLVDLASDGRLDPASVQGRAAALLQRLPKAQTLSGDAFLRIEEELLQRAAPQAATLPWLRRLGWGMAAVATVTASFVLGLRMRPSLPSGSNADAVAVQTLRPAAVHEVRLPDGSLASLRIGPGGQLRFSGPGALSLQDSTVAFRDGQLHVESGDQPLLIQVGSRRVTVSARGSARLAARLSELVYVAAFVGSVDVSDAEDRSFQSFSVPAGAAWPPAAPAAEPTSTVEAAPVAPSPAVRAQRGSKGAAPVANKPAPAVAPALGPPAVASPQSPGRLLAESQLLGKALQRLHREKDARGALLILDDYSNQFADGTLREEASAARVDALMLLDRRGDALQVLDSTRFTKVARGGELRLLRGELRAHAGRCREAISDFDSAQKSDHRDDGPIAERAIYGLATCRLQLGERGLAREALRKYLDLYPAGRFSDAAREALQKL